MAKERLNNQSTNKETKKEIFDSNLKPQTVIYGEYGEAIVISNVKTKP